MIDHNPKRRICAFSLVNELSGLTQIWKTQICENFLKPIRRRNSSFSISNVGFNRLENFTFGTNTHAINNFKENSWERGDHVKIDEIFLPKEPLQVKLVIKEKKPNNLGSMQLKKRKRKKLITSQTLASNIARDYQYKRNKNSVLHTKKLSSNFWMDKKQLLLSHDVL